MADSLTGGALASQALASEALAASSLVPDGTTYGYSVGTSNASAVGYVTGSERRVIVPPSIRTLIMPPE